MWEGKTDKAMNNRGGFPVKNVLYAVFLLVLVYVVYLYHGSQSKLSETEMTVERYRREASNRITEIQDLIKTKDRLQESCQNEKHEHGNRINAINQKHAMLQSQFKETEADFMKLKNDMENMRSEHMQAETQHATEYQQFKQQKELEISGLKDDLANGNQHNEDLSKSVVALQQQIQNLQISQQKLVSDNALLHDQVESQKHVAAQQPLNPNPQGNFIVSHQRQISPLGNNNQGSDTIQNMKIAQMDLSNILGKKEKPDESHLEALNAHHQVLPPGNNIGLNDTGKDKNPAVISDSKDERGVNPDDEQKVQIQEPNLDNADKHEGGGEADRDGNINTGDVEEERGAVAAREEEEAGEALNRPLNPLALGQMQEPQLPHKDEQNQQQPPLFPDNSNDANDKDDQYVDDGDDNGDENGLERHEEDQLEEDEEEDENFDENINARELNEDQPHLPRENNYMDRQHEFGAMRDGA